MQLAVTGGGDRVTASVAVSPPVHKKAVTLYAIWRSERDSNPRAELPQLPTFQVGALDQTRRSLRGDCTGTLARPRASAGGVAGEFERLGILGRGEVSEWFKVPLSKSGVVTSHRGFESPPLRHIL
jgi:hypothetical protein